MNEHILVKADLWTQEPFDIDTRNEIKKLVDEDNQDELTDRFYKDLEFGTGGLRGKIGAGSNRMNMYTVGVATQGLADYLKDQALESFGVVIAYDSRNFSKEFAEKSAQILAANSIKVYLFKELTPTPLCSYAIRKLNAASGIVITASHNPPEYNGYKVYFKDGCQIVPPQDKEIIHKIRSIDSFSSIKQGNFDTLVKNGNITLIGDDLWSEYIDEVVNELSPQQGAKSLKIVFSPLHGTGYSLVPRLLAQAGFHNLTLVAEQAIPDGNFPTVTYPNPEEKETLVLAIRDAKSTNADILLATDPDADRIGVGIKDGQEYTLLNGNQTAALLCDYTIAIKKKYNNMPNNPLIIKTIITSELMTAICYAHNVEIKNVLTGFKWIGALMRECEDNHSHNYLFGCEESYGFLPINFVRDKDAVSTALLICEMAEYYKLKGQSLLDRLIELYREYGLFLEDMHYVVLEGADGSKRIQKIMTDFRNNPPHEINGSILQSVSDYQSLEKKDSISGTKSELKGFPSSNVLQYFYADGSSFTIRPSGTEPKIKFYISVIGKIGDAEYLKELRNCESQIKTLIHYINNRIDNM